MFSDLDSDDFARLGKIAGAGLFAISFFLPGVHVGPNYDSGLTCATWTLSGTASFIASVFGPDGPNGFLFFFMVSGWISPLAIVGVFIRSEKARRVIAKASCFWPCPGLFLHGPNQVGERLKFIRLSVTTSGPQVACSSLLPNISRS